MHPFCCSISPPGYQHLHCFSGFMVSPRILEDSPTQHSPTWRLGGWKEGSGGVSRGGGQPGPCSTAPIVVVCECGFQCPDESWYPSYNPIHYQRLVGAVRLDRDEQHQCSAGVTKQCSHACVWEGAVVLVMACISVCVCACALLVQWGGGGWLGRGSVSSSVSQKAVVTAWPLRVPISIISPGTISSCSYARRPSSPNARSVSIAT